MSKTLESLKKKQQQITARIQKLEAAKKTRERKQETRRKILVGAYYLDLLKAEGRLDELRERMETYLTRDTDRKIFNLPKKETK